MPYAELPHVDRATRLALAGQRWDAMLASKPDLGAAIALQRKLIGHVLDACEEIAGSKAPRLSLPPRYVTTKLGAGIPALTAEPIQVPVETMRGTLEKLVRSLAEGGGGEATRAIASAIAERKVDAGALLTLAVRREQGTLRTFATKAGLGHDLLWLVCDLAAAPFANALLGSVFGPATPGTPLRDALDEWSRGYCPLCGSWPAYVEHRDDARRLRCSFCAAAWDVAAGGCLYCGERGETFTTFVPDANRPNRRIEACGSCRGYAKVLDDPSSLPFPLLPIADLDSMDLDITAMQRGSARPAIRQFARR